jgi:predicted TIM-barrel fold metal-dependent hydrolase
VLTIDSQVHVFDRDRPDIPWAVKKTRLAHVDGEQMIKAMDAVGVDAAVIVSPFAVYRFDGRYAAEVAAAHPGRFAIVKPVHPADPALEDTIAEWAALDAAVGIRLFTEREATFDPDQPGVARMLDLAAQHGLAVNLMCTGRLREVGQLAARHPNTRLVIDHLGIVTPVDEYYEEPFADLPAVLALAAYDNVAIKVSGVCAVSHDPFPYADIWDPLARVFDAYGLDRCMWGTDWTRTPLLTYRQAVEAFRVTDRLSVADREMLMGGALRGVYNWTPGAR